MKKRLVISIMAVVAIASFGAPPSFYDDFEGFTGGHTFTAATNYGWQASSAAVYVTNNAALTYAGTNALFMGNYLAMTNTQNASPNLKVWTDFWIKPTLGIEMMNPPTNTASVFYYFNTNGFIVMATPTGWSVCTNDVWGNSITPATNNAFVRMSIFQDYNTSTQAVFLDSRLIIQDCRFLSTAGSYSNLLVQNTDSNCWLDNVWVKTNFDTATLTNNFNGDGMADAQEIDTYGYARRTLYVCKMATNLAPLYATITNALVDWRPRDSIHVITGDYSGETVVLAANPSNMAFEGDAFAVASLTVASNASVSFSQTISCGTLTVSGQVAMALSASLTSTTATVAGSGHVTMASNSTFWVSGALSVLDAGLLDFATNSQLVATLAGVNLSGSFSISSTWGSGSLVSMPLPFSDNFDLYADNTVVTNLKFRGWYASAGSVAVTNGVYHSGMKSVVLPSGTSISNSINTAAQKIWTDFFIRPQLGIEPFVPATNTSSFLAYANTNGWLVVATAGGGWYVCSNQVNGVAPTPLSSNVFTRVTVCQTLSVSPPTFSVFVANNLVAQCLTSPASISSYTAFSAENRDSVAYMDDVLISTAVPSGMSSDAYEINTYGQTIASMPRGTIFRFR